MKTKIKIGAYILRGAVATLLFSRAIVALSSASNVANHPPKAPAPENNTTFSVNGHESASSVAAPARRRNRMLTFADRVAYRRSIEEVYWRHRIWPKERPDPKPSLDAVMSQAQLEEKVAGYMRNSQAFEGYYHRPITADELETEMDRIAKYSKQPNVLRELFEALGNDPFVIAECLARPVFAERLLPRSIVHEARQTIRAVTQTVATTAKYTLPLIQDTEGGCSNDTWTATSTINAPTARAFHTAVWTGIELIIWGGQNSVNVFSTGSL